MLVLIFRPFPHRHENASRREDQLLLGSNEVSGLSFPVKLRELSEQVETENFE